MKTSRIEPIDMFAMDSLKAINSVFPISDTLQRSSSGYFLVKESKAIQLLAERVRNNNSQDVINLSSVMAEVNRVLDKSIKVKA